MICENLQEKKEDEKHLAALSILQGWALHEIGLSCDLWSEFFKRCNSGLIVISNKLYFMITVLTVMSNIKRTKWNFWCQQSQSAISPISFLHSNANHFQMCDTNVNASGI